MRRIRKKNNTLYMQYPFRTTAETKRKFHQLSSDTTHFIYFIRKLKSVFAANSHHHIMDHFSVVKDLIVPGGLDISG